MTLRPSCSLTFKVIVLSSVGVVVHIFSTTCVCLSFWLRDSGVCLWRVWLERREGHFEWRVSGSSLRFSSLTSNQQVSRLKSRSNRTKVGYRYWMIDILETFQWTEKIWSHKCNNFTVLIIKWVNPKRFRITPLGVFCYSFMTPTSTVIYLPLIDHHNSGKSNVGLSLYSLFVFWPRTLKVFSDTGWQHKKGKGKIRSDTSTNDHCRAGTVVLLIVQLLAS